MMEDVRYLVLEVDDVGSFGWQWALFNFLLEQYLAFPRYYGQTLPFGNASFDKDCQTAIF